MSHQLTLHIVNEIPWSNLNRDESGLPKRMRQGGVPRGLLSSQSIKRGARTDYENNTHDLSYRTANLDQLVVDRVLALNPDADVKEVTKKAKALIGKLTKGDKAAAAAEGKESGRSAWLSQEEIEVAAQVLIADSDEDYIVAGKTGALAIAAFGRMFANRNDLNTEAAIAVSPAVSTHATIIESDYFTTSDDAPVGDNTQAATYLGVSHYLSGIFYRSVTIDRDQLKAAWTGIDNDTARAQLEALVTSLIYGMPRGKKNATAPWVAPALVLAETQEYRTAYDFDTPVQPDPNGGYLAPTIKALRSQREAAKQFDPENFGTPEAVAGTYADLSEFGVEVTNRPGMARLVADWILQ